MSVKAVLLLCAQVFLVQAVFGQCTSRAAVDASGIAGPYGRYGLGLAAPAFGSALAYDGLAAPFAYDGLVGWAGRDLGCDGFYPAIAPALDFTPTSGGGLPVTSASAVPPTGISFISENAYDGILAVAGELPFVGTTSIEGVVPSIGAGAINHGCGNGLNIMTALSDSSSPASVATYGPAGPYGIGAPALAAAPAFAGAPLAAPAFAGAPYAAPVFAGAPLAAPAFAGAPCAGPAFTASALAAPAFAYDGLFYDAPYAAAAYPYDTFGYSALDGIEFTATSGGSLPVSSASAVPPTGIAVTSETVYEGPLVVAGELPFVGTVGLEGVLPTAGGGAINHACGNGINAMVSETTLFAPGYAGAYGPAAAISPAAAVAPGYGYPSGFARRGYGCAI